MNDKMQNPADKTWIQVAETWGDAESAIVVGLLHAANIPTYIDSNSVWPMAAFGQTGGPGKVYVPATFYDLALTLLDDDDEDMDDEDDFLASLDTPPDMYL